MENKEILLSSKLKKTENKFKEKLSKEKNLHPFIVTNTSSASFLNNNNNKINEKEKEKEKENDKSSKNKEIKKQIKKDDNNNKEIKSFDEMNIIKDNLAYSRIERHSPANNHISQSINKLSTGDDMDILNELISLCDFLSLSSERIGYNPNMSKLLEEICKNLTKIYLPEIIIYSLQCINYILDINSTLVHVLKSIDAITTIMNIITSVEDITCIDYIIKIFDKISTQNTKILLEKGVFENFIVNIFDFLSVYQKKSIMKICYNISLRRVNSNEYNSYFKPALNVLINIIRIDKDDNNDNLFIVEKALNILYNIINSIKYGDTSLDKEKKDDNLLDELITNYNLIENFMDILNKYFIENNQIITDIIIKTILKTIAIILEASLKGMDKILSSKFLEIIAGTINNEFNIDSKSNNNKNNNNNNNRNNARRNSSLLNRRGIMFLHEFFDILIALFPSWKFNTKNQKKILSEENKKYYEFFCQNIFLPLINNITNKSSSLILTNLSKLILAFINNANKDDVILFLPSKPISKIIIKLLDTKNNSNIIDAFSLIKSLLEKVPENYIVNFVREGIVHNLKNYKFEQKTVEKKSNTLFRDFDKYLLSPFQTKHELDLNFKNIKSKDKLKEKESDKDKNEKDNNEEDKNKNIFGSKDKDKIDLDSSDGIEIFKEKKIEDNIISIKKINTNFRKSKESLKLTFNDIMGEENDNEYKLRLESEAENPEEEQEDEEMDNNEESGRVEDSENEEKEENEDREDGKNSFYISQSYSEDNDKEKEKDKDKDKDKEKLNDEEIEKKSKKEKENKEVKNLNININFTPKLKTQAQKETKLKKLEFNYDEFSDNKNSSSNLNINDIFLVDDKSQNQKDEKKIEKDKIIEKIDEKNEEENSKFNVSKNSKLNSEDPFSFLHRRRRFKDYLKQRMNYEDLEDNLSNLEMKTIQEKNKDLLTNYLSDEKISQYLSSIEDQTKDNLIKIKDTLSDYQQLLSSSSEENNEKEKHLKNIIDILTDETVCITLFELESSQILLSLCKYFDPQFSMQYNKLKDDQEYNSVDKLINNMLDKNLIPKEKIYNNEIFNKINTFLNCFQGDKNKVINFIKLLNESIQSMNCPIFHLSDNKRNIYNNLTMRQMRKSQAIKIKMIYSEQIFRDKVLNTDLIIDGNFKTKLCELNMFFKMNKKMMLIVNNNTPFKNMTINLLSLANIPLIANDSYDISIKYFIENAQSKDENNIDKMDIEIEESNNDNNKDKDKDKDKDNEKEKEKDKNNNLDEVKIKDDDKEEIMDIKDFNDNNIINNDEVFDINESWTYKTFIDNYSKKYKMDSTPYINFGLSIKPKNSEDMDKNSIKIEKESDLNIDENASKGFLDYYSQFIQDMTDFTECVNFDKYSFIKDYHNNILYCISIYFSKRLMPSLYLLSIFNMCINKYNELFNLPKSWFINSDKNRSEWKTLFFNLKIDQFISKISIDGFKVSSTTFPILGKYIVNNNYCMTRFPTRLLSFKTSFSSSYKSLINLQNHMKHNNPNYHSKYSVTLKKTMRIKINVERDKIIEHGFNIINDDITSKFKGYLEFEYSGEIGNGLGPTLEFYTLIIDKITENQDLWYKTTDGTLYPRLLCDKEIDMNQNIIRLFKLLGYIIGRAIYDDRLLDIPLNKVFWNLVLDKPILFKNIKYIDSNLYKTILDFINLIQQKQEYIKTNNIDKTQNINFDDIILYNNCKLSDLDIYFVFPGYNNIELKPNGNDILLTMNNIEEYVNLIYDFLFYRGIDKCMHSFREGFNINFNIDKLKCFTSSEIEEYICGSVDVKWDKNVLLENLKPEHGYTNQSKTFNDLITFMCNLDKKQRKQFLIFSTGSSRLPIGGFKSLSPKLTVVKKHCEEEHTPDDYLPTVMTCQNYLKIPEYSSYNILEQKILLAMNEGCNEFSLS